MSSPWYRSDSGPVNLAASRRRLLRNWIRARLPEPDVAERIAVLVARRSLPRLTTRGWRSEFQGLFSEFHSVLGALLWAEARGAAGLRVDFTSPIYRDPEDDPNWWNSFFDRSLFRFDADRAADPHEVRLDRVLARYGQYGGFNDIVHGPTAYHYPMTYGVDRLTLHRLIEARISVRREIRAEAERVAAQGFQPGSFVVGVHYRGTDATHGRRGWLTHYRTAPVPYAAYAAEVRHVLERRAIGRYQIYIATDETDCVEFMEREFPGRVLSLPYAPRAGAAGRAVHLDSTMPVSNRKKGVAAMVDALVLASTDYLVKGRSNLSDASLVFNPRLPYSFYPDLPPE